LQQSVKEGERQEEKHSDMLYIYTTVTPILSIAVVPNTDTIALEGI
jgi:nitrate reductase NapE component